MIVWGAAAAAAMMVLSPGAAAPDQKPQASEAARQFGAREQVIDISLSPDAKRIVFIAPGPGKSTVVAALDVATGETKIVTSSPGDLLNFVSCGWSSNTRLVCKLAGTAMLDGKRVGYSRTLGIDPDGSHLVYLGRRSNGGTRANQFDGDVIDWRNGDGRVLMTRDWIPEEAGSVGGSGKDGLGVELVDTVTGRATTVEQPTSTASRYVADGQGNVRIRASDDVSDQQLTGLRTYQFRGTDTRGWRPFSKVKNGSGGLAPVAVDGTRDIAYAVQTLDGRDALYAVSLDGSMKTQLVSSNPAVDVGEVVTIGRRGRVIGATYTTDRRQVDYFDPTYKALAAGLARALPKTPNIAFVGADADEQHVIVFAGSDTDPGSYYLYTRATRHLDAMIVARPQLAKAMLAPMKAVTYKAADGTMVPAYLTLPVGGTQKGLRAIVLPHGGPGYRDDWGFDWLVQFFAARGYAVLQPQYRGSTGYGDAWYANNGWHSWQLAIGDVCDGGRWLVKEGIADPTRLAIVGWSYGGYAALQANVVDPDLFKAVVAVAPVTDLAMTKRESVGFTNERLVERQIGSGEGVAQGSPARHADRFKAPVLMFHGDADINVGVAQSRAMDAALRHAGKSTRLVVFPALDHQLDDADVRARLLDEADGFPARIDDEMSRIQSHQNMARLQRERS